MSDEIVTKGAEILGTLGLTGLIVRAWVKGKFGELAHLVSRVPRDIAWKIAARRQLRDQTREINQLKKDIAALRDYAVLLSKQVRANAAVARRRATIPDVPDIHMVPLPTEEDEDLKVEQAEPPKESL